MNNGVPKGIRTPVAAVKGQCPRPLDDGDGYFGGDRRGRTADLLHAMQALYQLSYTPNEQVFITILPRMSSRAQAALAAEAEGSQHGSTKYWISQSAVGRSMLRPYNHPKSG